MTQAKVVPKVGWGGVAAMTSFEVRSVYELLDVVRQKPGLFIGEPSITALNHFINGFEAGLRSVDNAFDDVEPPFIAFHDWIAARLGFPESTPGWRNMLLEACANEASALERFFTELDAFRQQPHPPKSVT